MTAGQASVERDLTYAEALRAIQERGRFGVRLGLARTRALLRELGHPERKFRGALVAGTNGKGSVLALTAAVLREAGYRVGATPKPHLVTYRERLQVDDAPVDPQTFARLIGQLLPIADRVSTRHGEPTEFELLTAAMFQWFAEQFVDLAVIEVGLGGRLDATHAWDGGVAVITNVDLDHTERLGPTIRHIAREKAAIIERGDRAVTGARGDALTIVRARAARLDVPLREVRAAPLLGQDRAGIRVLLAGLGEVRVGLLGRHQAANVAVADATLDALGDADIAATGADARRRGYATARWPGRLELLSIGGRDVLLDGAHNPAGAAALATALDDLRPLLLGSDGLRRAPVTVVMAAMADKDIEGIVGALAGSDALRDARIICTRLDATRALPADRLAAAWSAVNETGGERSIVTKTNATAALDLALATGDRWADGPVIVCGSLYLVGDVRARLVDDPALRDPIP